MRLWTALISFSCWAAILTLVRGSEPEPAVEIEGANPAQLTAELKQLQGNWRLISHENEEHKKLFGKGGAWKLTVSGNSFRMTIGTDQNATFKIDPTQSPKHLDRTFRYGDNPKSAKTTWLGIYKLEGDHLTLCHAMSKEERPSEFATRQGTRLKVLVFERVHEDEAQPKARE